MSIEKALKVELSAVSGLSGKVFPLIAPEGFAGYYCVYELNNTDRVMTVSSFDGLVESNFSIAVYHETYSQAKDLMDLVVAKVKTFLLRNIGTNGPFCQSVQIENEVEFYDEGSQKFQTQIDILISYKEV